LKVTSRNGGASPTTSLDAGPQSASGGEPASTTAKAGEAIPPPTSGSDATAQATSNATAASGATPANFEVSPAPANSANTAADPGSQSSTSAPSAKSTSNDGTVDVENDGSAASAPATAAQQPQAAANPAQPIAAAVILNNLADAAPASPDAAGVIATGGEPAKGRTNSALTSAAGKDSSLVQDATDSAPANQTASAAAADIPAKTVLEAGNEGAKGQKPNGSGSLLQQARTQLAGDAPGTPPPTDTSLAAADTVRTGTQSAAASAIPSSGVAAGTSNAQTAVAPNKPSADGVPNFGFSASVATTSSGATDPAPSGAPSTAAVPVAGLAVAIAARAQAGTHQFDIRLDPPELGRIDVRLAVDGSGQVTTHMTTERADTLQLLQSQQPQLERALEQAGLKTADNGLQFSLRDQSFTGQNNNGSNPQPTTTAQIVIPDPLLAPTAATQIYARAGLGGGVDIRV
jgi:flagellar hook-length control protein FliK